MDSNSLAEKEIRFFPAIKLGPNGGVTDNLCPILEGKRNETGLHLRNCDVYLDSERKLTVTTLQSTKLETTSIVTEDLVINGTPIKKVTTKITKPLEPNSLVTLGGITQYVQSEINLIKSPWAIGDNNEKDNIYYRNGAVGIGNLEPLILSSSKEGTGMIAVGTSLISIDKSNLKLNAEGVQIVKGKFQLGESSAVNKITNTINISDDAGNSSTLPTAKAVKDYVNDHGKTFWKPSKPDKGVYYNGGNVGIGTDNPIASLHVATGAIMPSSGNELTNGIVFPSNPGKGSFDSAWIRYYAKQKTESCVLEIGISNDTSVNPDKIDHIAIMPSGMLGIGTTTPSLGMVHIGNSLKRLMGNVYHYLGTPESPVTGRYSPKDTAIGSYSLYAIGRIAAEEFNALSDARIKEVCGQSDGILDLATLLNIQVTDYSYKDKIQRGGGQHKKVIGQQIAMIFPQAVKTHTDVIPDIYHEATIRGGWVQLPDHGLSVGERVRLIWKDSEPVIYNIEEASKDSFRVPLQFEGEIFVYGREVDDFHVVDYEAISMLHVSATQELYKIIQGLKQDVENLKTQLATMNGTGLSPIAHA